MITRLEIDGFKSFVDFTLDVPPFLVVVGANNGGKSNLLEALEFASCAATDEDDALFRHRCGNALELFHRDDDGHVADRFSITVDALDREGPLAVEAYRDRLHISVLRLPLVTDWFFLRIQPDAIRRPANLGDERALSDDGSNLAAVIARLAESGALKGLLVDAAAIIPHLIAVEPVADGPRGEIDFELVFDRGGRFRPTVASDGTLRILAILAAAHDPDHQGTLLIDEIETGLHPAFQGELPRRLRNRTLDGSGTQVMVTTHSPVVLSEILPLDPGAIVYLSQAVRGLTREDGSKTLCSYTHARTFMRGGERGTYVTAQEVRNYLNTVGPVEV